MSDQYALAAIAYEWLFGRPLTHNGERPIEVRSMPGVDRLALSRAFTRALSPDPDDRFASCAAFCDALHGAIVPELPLLADVDDFAAEDADEIRAAVVPPAVAATFDSDRGDELVEQVEPNAEDLQIVDDESILAAAPFDPERDEAFRGREAQPDVDTIDPRRADSAPAAVPSWSAGAAATPPARTMESPRFSALALFLAVIVGAVFGFAAGYMARPRALQSGAAQQIAVAPETDAPIKSTEPPAPKASASARPSTGELRRDPAEATAGREGAPVKIGRLLVRSTPSAASVSVDGVARGETPLALRDLDPGTRTVVVERRGYVPETRRVVITKARPARTLDVRLASAAPVPPKPKGEGGPRPSTPATFGKPAAATTGSLSVDSRPSGAAVTINGKPGGTTPLTLDDLAPGEYRIVISMPGYRNFATTVRVVAGERVRAAASLTVLEQQ